MSRLSFLTENTPLLLFGFLLTFFSCFGQTIIVSLYVPDISAKFGLSNTGISSLYALATLGSAALLPWVGRYVDMWRLSVFTLLTMLLLAGALLTLSLAPLTGVVLLGFWGMRLGGQGLMSHTAASALVRGFEQNRGKAIGLASLGYPASEAVMPLLIAALIAWLGWRGALQASAVWLILVLLPLALWLVRYIPTKVRRPVRVDQTSNPEDYKTVRNPLRLLRGRVFWVIIPTFFLLALLNTAIFFFQLKLGEARGWPAGWVAGSVAAFAVASASGMLLSGPLVDRLTARTMLPFYMTPYVLGLILLASFTAPWVYPVALFLLGLSNGASSPVKNAVLAELYGAGIIGSVRGIATTVIVFSTALGPPLFGILIDAGVGFGSIFLGSMIVVMAAMGWSLGIVHPVRVRRWLARWRSKQ